MTSLLVDLYTRKTSNVMSSQVLQALNDILDDTDEHQGGIGFYKAHQGRPSQQTEEGYILASTNPAIIAVMKFISDSIEELRSKPGKKPLTRRMTLRSIRDRLHNANSIIDIELEQSSN